MIPSEIRRLLKSKVLLSENNKDLLSHINEIAGMLENNNNLRIERSDLDKIEEKVKYIWLTVRNCVYDAQKKII